MKMWNKFYIILVGYKFIFLISALIAFVSSSLMVYRGYMNYQGYCWNEQRYLTSQEKMERAVSELLANYPPAIIPKQDMEDKSGETVERIIPFEEFKDGARFRSWSLGRPDIPILYGSVAGFFAENPNCCELRRYPNFDGSPEFEGPSFFDLIFDKKSKYVKFTYWVKYREDGVEKKVWVNYYADLSNCGEVAWTNTIPRFVEDRH